MPIDYDTVALALSAWETGFIDRLTKAAESTFIFSSILTIGSGLRKGIIADELYETGYNNLKSLNPEAISALKPLMQEQAPKFVDPYHEALLRGGRNVNIGIWGEPDARGVRPYNGYETKWVPWLEQYNAKQREEIYGILTSGDTIPNIKDQLGVVFQQRKNYAAMVAETEVLNNSAIVTVDRYDKLGINKFLWVCSSLPNSPCAQYCSSFCGNIYTKETLPAGGERIHPRCRCSVHPVIRETNAESWADLEPAASSDYAKDLSALKKLETKI
jgi:hypothetical protein